MYIGSCQHTVTAVVGFPSQKWINQSRWYTQTIYIYISTHKTYTLVSDAWTTCATKNHPKRNIGFPPVPGSLTSLRKRSRIDRLSWVFRNDSQLFLPSDCRGRLHCGWVCVCNMHRYMFPCLYIYINTSIDVYSNMCIIYDYVFIDKQISTVCICICTYVYVTVNFWKAFRIAESMAQRLPSTASPQLSLNGTSFCLASFLKNEGRGIFFGKTQHQCHARPFWLLATKHLPEFLKSWRHHYPKQGPPKKNATHGGRSYSSRLVAHES